MTRLTLALGLLGASLRAHATVPDTYGVGADHIGMGGGGVAHVADGAAALMNPAGLVRVRRPMVSAGVSWGMVDFADPPPVWWDTNRDGQVDERDPPLELTANVDDTLGLHLDLARQIGSRFGVGLAAYVPLQRLFRLKTFEPSLPTYVMHDNRAQRYVLAAAIGGMPVSGLYIGVGADVVPRVAFDVSLTADIAVTGDDSANDLGELVGDVRIDIHEIELDVVPGIAPMVGVQLDFGSWSPALEGLMFGATWRGEIGVPIDARMDIQANLSASDLGELDPFVLAGIVGADLALFDHYVPMKVELGLSYRHARYFTAYADARWTDWRGMLLSVAQLESARLTTPLFDLNDAIRDGNDYQLNLRSTWSVRAGAEMRLPRFEFTNKFRYLQIVTRAGFGWEPTPLAGQGDNSAFLDSDRWWLAGGLGFETFDPLNLFNGPFHVDLFFQYHQLTPAQLGRSTSEPRAGYPVDTDRIDIGGSILVLGAEVGFAY
jgi:hypothetical protein